ncbi:lipoprotein [Salmonella enterica subsp. enterica]|uniref:Lipoprotein n=1 Tax=Salmonella enterica I TaxID=59201 RepID=A0A447PSG4_SALET|nr:lipoprotein [Salmonella enterica subsp. enterica]
MAFKFKTFAAVGALIGSLALAGCGQDEKDPNHIKVGVIVGAEQQVAEVAQKVAKEKYGLDVELVTFNDYVLPNEALSKGDIDANAFQHKPYLDQQIKDRGYKLVSVGKTFVYPIAGYSKKIKSLDELKDGSQVAVPNDPTNLGRSLLLLQKVGLIKLKDGRRSASYLAGYRRKPEKSENC